MRGAATNVREMAVVPTVPQHQGAQRLFDTVFRPLYPPDVRGNLHAARGTFAHAANDTGVLELVDEIAEAFKHLAPGLVGLPGDALDDTDASVHRLGAALDRSRRDRLLHERTLGQLRTPLLATVAIHGTLYVARCIVRNHGGDWLVRRPLWETTVVLRSKLGEAELSIFQWWLKSLSDDEVDRRPLGDRYRTYVEVPCFDGDALPVLQPEPRAPIPPLPKPSFAKLFRHLKTHAPQIRGPGDHFPSPERFAEMAFQSMQFSWVGGGRMLLMHGTAQRQGAHLIWMDRHGFVKAAFFPCDDVPSHIVRCADNKLQVIVSVEKQTRIHEMPWWGM